MSERDLTIISATVESPSLTVVSAEVQGPSLTVVSATIEGRTGPAGPPGSGTDHLALTTTNAEATTIYAGQAVAMGPTGVGVIRASRDDPVRRAIGIAKTTALASAAIDVIVLGICEVADWTVATGAAWLPPLSRLWLGLDGALTTSPSAGPGEFDQELGSTTAPQKTVVLPGRILLLT